MSENAKKPLRASDRVVIALVVAIPVVCLIFFFGIALDFEFPYALTIYRAGHAHTVSGANATEVITRTLGVPKTDLHWHRCGEFKDFEKDYPPGFVRVSAWVVAGEPYPFAFNPDSGLIYSVPFGTGGWQTGSAEQFPLIAPIPRHDDSYWKIPK